MSPEYKENKNGLYKKNYLHIYAAIFYSVLFLAILLVTAKLFSNNKKLERELGRYRIELEHSEEQQRELTVTVDKCRELVSESNNVINGITGEVASIREGIKQLSEYIEELENCLYSDNNR